MIALEHVGKRYGAGAPILSDISLQLETGGFYFLTGASGAGKTTLLKLIYLAELPSRGRVSLLGTDAAMLDRAGQAALRRRIGIVFQDFRLLDELTAAENVALPLRIAGVAERQIRANVPELLAWVGLADRGDSVAATLSGGERQRVAIARALANRPSLLLCDEPTGNLDSDTAATVLALLDEVHVAGFTVVVITHDREVAARTPRRITIRDGVLHG